MTDENVVDTQQNFEVIEDYRGNRWLRVTREDRTILFNLNHLETIDTIPESPETGLTAERTRLRFTSGYGFDLECSFDEAQNYLAGPDDPINYPTWFSVIQT